MDQPPIAWSDLNFPPINLWSAPKTKSFARAQQESIQEGLKRVGYESYWVRNGPYGRYMLRVRAQGNAGDFGLWSPGQAVDAIEQKSGRYDVWDGKY